MGSAKLSQLLFIHGAGDEGYEADKTLVTSLASTLGNEYDIRHPETTTNESLPDFGWVKQISEQIAKTDDEIILAGHSLGASMILKCLSEQTVSKNIKGIFLLATPFWSGDEEWKSGLKLKENFEERLPAKIPVFLYHCRDDKVVPFSHLQQYRRRLPRATVREIEQGGHQFEHGMTETASDIKSISQ